MDRRCICGAGPFLRDNAFSAHRDACIQLQEQRKSVSKNASQKLRNHHVPRVQLRSSASIQINAEAVAASSIDVSGTSYKAQICLNNGGFPKPSRASNTSQSCSEDQSHFHRTDETSTRPDSVEPLNSSSTLLGIASTSRGRVTRLSTRGQEYLEYLKYESLLKEPLLLAPQDVPLPAPLEPLPNPGINVGSMCSNIRTNPNTFGLIRVFPRCPAGTHDPDELQVRDNRLSHSIENNLMTSPETLSLTSPRSFYPFPNENAFLLGEWFYSSNQKSLADFKALRGIIGRDDFRSNDIKEANWAEIHNQLGEMHGDKLQSNQMPKRKLKEDAKRRLENAQAEGSWLKLDAGWKRSSVSISLRFPLATDGLSSKARSQAKKRKKYTVVNPPFPLVKPSVVEEKNGLYTYVFNDFYHRSIMEVIRDKVSNRHACRNFHLVPYQLLWRRNAFSDKHKSFPHDFPEAQSPHNPQSSAPPKRPPTKEYESEVFGEFYSSRTFLKAYKEVQEMSLLPGPNVERVVVAIMFSSDVTHLASFGDAEVWPLYMFFLNDSKYERAKPSENLCEQLGFFNKLPDSFKDFVYNGFARSGHLPQEEIFAYAAKLFVHAQWKKLLEDPDFLYAYAHGKIYASWDGIFRLYVPRIFIYSADYKEKAIMATIRQLGLCPCPVCLIKKDDIITMGIPTNTAPPPLRVDDEKRNTKIEKALGLINVEGQNINSAAVERLLSGESLVPVKNAFSVLRPFGFNLFSMFLPDLLHEFLLGIWKMIFVHLLRLLVAMGSDELLAELDQRYRNMPTFGKDKIRRFSRNVSQLKAFAARDFEDLLQCSIPVFDGLMPEPYNQKILRFLFMLTYWHALADLRLHTRQSLDLLKDVTTLMALEAQTFLEDVCKPIVTKELAVEAERREKAKERKAQKELKEKQRKDGGEAGTTSSTGTKRKSSTVLGNSSNKAQKRQRIDSANAAEPQSISVTEGSQSSRLRQIVKFHFDTYKWHRLGDYYKTIEEYGTTDSYTSALGEHEHKKPKSYYTKTNKKDFIRQFVRIERRKARTWVIRQKHQIPIPAELHAEDAQSADPASAYHISKCGSKCIHLVQFLQTYKDDPAVADFSQKLRLHLLPMVKAAHLKIAQGSPDQYSRHIPLLQQNTGSMEDNLRVIIEGDALFPHPTIRINYTTYDVCRDQDVLNPNTSHRDFMVLAKSTEEKYWYARLLGIFHVMVSYLGPGSVDRYARRFEFVWVRWFEPVSQLGTWKDGRLQSLKLGDLDDSTSFGFVHPSCILRACHISPNFRLGMLPDGGAARSELAGDNEGWCQFYVLRFSDRDLAMRDEWGLAVGHIYANRFTTEETTIAPEYSDVAESTQKPPRLVIRLTREAIESALDPKHPTNEIQEEQQYVMGGFSSEEDEDDEDGNSDSETSDIDSDSENEQEAVERLNLDDTYGINNEY